MPLPIFRISASVFMLVCVCAPCVILFFMNGKGTAKGHATRSFVSLVPIFRIRRIWEILYFPPFYVPASKCYVPQDLCPFLDIDSYCSLVCSPSFYKRSTPHMFSTLFLFSLQYSFPSIRRQSGAGLLGKIRAHPCFSFGSARW